MDELELHRAVGLIRDELVRAAAEGAGERLRFEVGPIGMEFAVELRKDVAAKGGFRAWVVSADVNAGLSRTTTHRINLTLTPVYGDGQPVQVSEEVPGGTGAVEGGSLFRPPASG
ncbi:hypothetical protein HHL19_21760 [Streptomyces sp. R302]|uniref:trypco2 family protein n=1 Tax=unclassified Streptomyces TaxID=2593676 RepID=UPI00145E5CEB|nr:hypothetical protein [Streptomyces sp. R301]NML81221.1 hypothetical protein [Streptomyces sp. R302]